MSGVNRDLARIASEIGSRINVGPMARSQIFGALVDERKRCAKIVDSYHPYAHHIILYPSGSLE